jgi:hypothetical protein
MAKFVVDLWLDGYEDEKEREEAEAEFIYEQLNMTASSVKIKKCEGKDHTYMNHCTEALADALKKDEGYRQSWKANIAMAFYDAWRNEPREIGVPSNETIHRLANIAADRFLTMFCETGSQPVKEEK